MTTSVQTSSGDFGKLLLRFTVAGLILFHGASKLINGVDWIWQMLEARGMPGFFAFGVYLAEVIAPMLIIMGVRTKFAALIIAFDMVMAVALVMSKQIFVVKEMGGGWGIELEAFFFLTSLVLFFLGGGRYSLSKSNFWD